MRKDDDLAHAKVESTHASHVQQSVKKSPPGAVGRAVRTHNRHALRAAARRATHGRMCWSGGTMPLEVLRPLLTHPPRGTVPYSSPPVRCSVAPRPPSCVPHDCCSANRLIFCKSSDLMSSGTVPARAMGGRRARRVSKWTALMNARESCGNRARCASSLRAHRGRAG